MPYLASTRPRLGAAAVLSSVLAAPPSHSTPDNSNTQTHRVRETPSRQRQRQRREAARNREIDERAQSPPNKQRQVTVEDLPDPEAPGATTTNTDRYKGLYVEEFPDPTAGAPISDERAPPPDLHAYMHRCGPMADPEHFEVAELLMTSGLTNVAKDRHLQSRKYAGKTPWRNCKDMFSAVDKLAHGPEFWQCTIPLFDGQRPRPQYMVLRDIIEVIRDFFANREFDGHIRYKPWRLYTSASKTERLYGDMAGSDWWWRELEKLIAQGKQDVTLAPLIIATDQTTLSVMCGGQKAYPVYVSFGNLDKDWRRKPSKHGTYLLGYLPVDNFEDISDDDERKRLKADLVHRAMETMLAPLRKASETGVEVWCPDGRLRRIYPRVAAYTADWPEQCLQCGTTEGGCPICKTSYADRSNFEDEIELREREETLNALRTYIATKNEAHLDLLDLRPIWPWWGDIAGVNLSSCVTPDLLHQAYQGVFKTHVLEWVKKIVGSDVLNSRFAAMPPAEGLARFTKGVTAVNKGRWTGRESKELLAQFLPGVLGTLSPEMAQLIRSLVDFMYQAHATTLTDADLDDMDENLRIFHEHKHILVGEGKKKIYEKASRFNKVAKLHMLRHWTHSIRELGTPDGFNTEVPENLHIEYAKVPWRASNKREPLPQMIRYLQRQDAIRVHRAYLDRYLAESQDNLVEDAEGAEESAEEPLVKVIGQPVSDDLEYRSADVRRLESATTAAENDVVDSTIDSEPVGCPNPVRCVASVPTVKKILIRDVVDGYGASNITSGIIDFLCRRCEIPRRNVMLSDRNFIAVWHKLYLYHPPPSFAPFDPVRRDVIRTRVPRSEHSPPGIWDVALYLERPNRLRPVIGPYKKHGLERYRAGRVRAIFTLPDHLRLYYPGQLAYIELFTPFPSSVSPFNRLNTTQPDLDSNNQRRTLVIPVSDIYFAAHLVPKFHLLDEELPLHCHTDLLSISQSFWLNHYYNHHFYQFIHHWRRQRRNLRQRLEALVTGNETPGPSRS